MRFIVNGVELTEAYRAAEEVTENIDREVFENYLDENEPIVEVCGVKFFASRILAELAETDLDCQFADWKDSLLDDLEHDIDHMNDKTKTFYGVEVVAVSEPDEDTDGYSIPGEGPEVLRAVDEVRQAELCPGEHRKCVCHICGKMVDPEWHDHADEEGPHAHDDGF